MREVDLADLASIDALAKAFLASERGPDLLVSPGCYRPWIFLILSGRRKPVCISQNSYDFPSQQAWPLGLLVSYAHIGPSCASGCGRFPRVW